MTAALQILGQATGYGRGLPWEPDPIQPEGLPVMTVLTPAADLAARLTMARTVTADYTRQPVPEPVYDGWGLRLSTARSRPDWRSWSARLYSALAELLGALDAVTSATGVAGTALLAPADAGAVLAALADAADWHESQATAWCDNCAALPDGLCDSHAAHLDVAGRYRSLARALGDDQ